MTLLTGATSGPAEPTHKPPNTWRRFARRFRESAPKCERKTRFQEQNCKNVGEQCEQCSFAWLAIEKLACAGEQGIAGLSVALFCLYGSRVHSGNPQISRVACVNAVAHL